MDQGTAETLARLLKAGDFERVVQATTELVQTDPSDGPALFLRASAHLKGKRPTSAISDVSRLLEQDPNYGAEAYYLRGACFLLLANSKEGPHKVLLLRRAHIDLEEAVLLDPADKDYLSLQQQVAGILGVNNQLPATSEAAWSIAEKVAKVAGTFFGAFLK